MVKNSTVFQTATEWNGLEVHIREIGDYLHLKDVQRVGYDQLLVWNNWNLKHDKNSVVYNVIIILEMFMDPSKK